MTRRNVLDLPEVPEPSTPPSTVYRVWPGLDHGLNAKGSDGVSRRLLDTVGGETTAPPSAAGSAAGTTLYARRITINDPEDVFTQALRIDLPADPAGTTRTAADGGKGAGKGAPDTWSVYFNGRQTGYGNEFGELRAAAAKPNTVAFRVKAHPDAAPDQVLHDWYGPAFTSVGSVSCDGTLTMAGQVNAAGRRLAAVREYVAAATVSGAYALPGVETATVHDLTLAGNVTLTLPAPAAGASVLVILRQDATGGRVVTWPADAWWPGGISPALSTAPDAVDVVSLISSDGAVWLGFTAGQAMAATAPPSYGTIVKRNSFEGGTDGTAISPANSGGTSGDAFDYASGSLIRYTAVNPIHGSLSLTTSGGTVNSSVAWSNVMTGHDVIFIRYYLLIDAYPASSVRPVFLDNGSGSGALWLSVNDADPGPAGTLAIENGDTSHLAVSATQLALSTVYRVEVKAQVSTQTVVVRLYEGEATTPLEEFQAAGWSSAGSASRLNFGQGADTTYNFAGHLKLDDVAIAYDDWVGPA